MPKLKQPQEPIEFHELKQLFFNELMKAHQLSELTGHFAGVLNVQIEQENQPIFWAKGHVNIGYDSDGNYQVHDISISEAGFQWPDFECELPNKYINEIEKYCKE